ncbi:amidohydrolase family protein [Fodinicola feengrottensis]|uniref:amidohydrolase family protein n=1 Tax=Fodinicola feengrottensis TaxID=435914 RepID=UPI0013D1833A|nr:amidohydrolase family protein [Fodinicola feengrottensis]
MCTRPSALIRARTCVARTSTNSPSRCAGSASGRQSSVRPRRSGTTPAHGNAEALAVAGTSGLHPCMTALPPTPGETVDLEGAIAVRMYPATHDFDPLDAAMDPLYERLVAQRLPLTVGLPEIGWPALDALAGRWPGLAVIVSALGYRTLRRLAAVFGRRPNLHADMVNFASHQGVEWFVRQWGAERLLFGTGTPVRDPAEAVARLSWSGLSDADRQLVGHGNAVRLFQGLT